MDQPQLPAPHAEVAVSPASRCPGYPDSGGYGNNYIDDPGSGGLIEYWRILRRRKGAVTLIAFLGLTAGVLLTLSQTPIYQARTALEIQDINENFLNMKQVTPVSDGNSYTALSDIQTQITLLQSESLIRRVLAKLKASSAATTTEPRPVFTEPRPFLAVGEQGSDPASRLAPWRKALNLPQPKASDDRNPGAAARNLTVKAIGQTRIVEVLCDSTDPHFAADFANTLAQEFIESNMEARWKMSEHTGEWLSRQLEDMRIKLERSEDTLQSYARRAGLLFTSDRSTSEKTNIAEDKLRQLQEELSKAQGERITRQSRWELTKTSTPEALPDVLTDSSLRALQDKVTELRRQRAELITTYTAQHSKVQRVEAQIAPLEAALQTERTAIIDRLRNDYEAALRREKLLATDYANQSRLVTDQAEKSIQYNILKREVDSDRQLYEAMLQRVKESSIASAMRASNVRIVDPAEPPALPYKPNLPINSAFGLLSGLLLGVAFVVVRERADRSLQSPGEASLYLNVPELGVIPSARAVRSKRLSHYYRNLRIDSPAPAAREANNEGREPVELVMSQANPSVMAESFRATLASIMFSGENGNRPRVIVVTSPSSGEGKTTVVTNLALALADINRRVLLIDGDLWKPRLHEIFAIKNERGLSNLLLEDGTPEANAALIVATRYPHLSLLPAGLGGGGSSRLLYSARMPELLKRFRREFDMVLIDTPPVQDIPDARVLGRLADAAVLVVRSSQTTRESALAARWRLSEDGTRVLGTVLNEWDPRKTSHVTRDYGYHTDHYQENGHRRD